MRPLFAYLRTVTVPTGVLAAAEDWGAADGVSSSLAERIDRAGGEFAELIAARPHATKADPFTDVVPFEALLHRV